MASNPDSPNATWPSPEWHPEEPAAKQTTPSSAMFIIGVMVVTAFVMILNETIVSIALPDLAKSMGVTTSTIQWLVSGFLVMMAVVIPTTGFLIERFSPRSIYLVSVTAFLLGTALCGIAPAFGPLLLGRIVQASGTAVMIPLVMTTVMRLIPADKRGATMGTISIVIGVAPAIGPTVGGAILAWQGWRWMFWLVLILALVMYIFAIIKLHVPFEVKRVPMDLLSVLLSAIGFAGFVYGLSSLGTSTGPIPAWVFVIVGALSLAAFVWRQRALQRQDRPLLDLRTFSYPRFRLALILSLLVFMALIGAGAILLPIYLQTVLGHGTFVAGLALLPGGIVMASVSRPVGNLYDRYGARPLVIPGSIGLVVALAGLALLGPTAPLWSVIVCDMILMCSLGTMMTPLMTDSLNALTDDLYSHGSAILATLQQVAGALGSTIFVAIAAVGSASAAVAPDATGLAFGFGAAAVVGVCAVIVALMFKKKIPTDSGVAELVGHPTQTD